MWEAIFNFTYPIFFVTDPMWTNIGHSRDVALTNEKSGNCWRCGLHVYIVKSPNIY